MNARKLTASHTDTFEIVMLTDDPARGLSTGDTLQASDCMEHGFVTQKGTISYDHAEVLW